MFWWSKREMLSPSPRTNFPIFPYLPSGGTHVVKMVVIVDPSTRKASGDTRAPPYGPHLPEARALSNNDHESVNNFLIHLNVGGRVTANTRPYNTIITKLWPVGHLRGQYIPNMNPTALATPQYRCLHPSCCPTPHPTKNNLDRVPCYA